MRERAVVWRANEAREPNTAESNRTIRVATSSAAARKKRSRLLGGNRGAGPEGNRCSVRRGGGRRVTHELRNIGGVNVRGAQRTFAALIRETHRRFRRGHLLASRNHRGRPLRSLRLYESRTDRRRTLRCVVVCSSPPATTMGSRPRPRSRRSGRDSPRAETCSAVFRLPENSSGNAVAESPIQRGPRAGFGDTSEHITVPRVCKILPCGICLTGKTYEFDQFSVRELESPAARACAAKHGRMSP